MSEKEPLKKLPGYSQGVRDNSAQRMLKMMAPVCPNSRIEYDVTTDGRRVPKQTGPTSVNCQLAGRGWWTECEARGHDPYFTTTKWYTSVDVLDEQGLVTGTKRVPHEERVPNVRQVAINRRINSGRGAVIAQQDKGFRRLRDFDYEEVCQFRNCQKPIDPRARSKAFGDYCSPYHLRLVAADQQGEFLQQLTGQFEKGSEERLRQKRDEQLRKAGSFAAE